MDSGLVGFAYQRLTGKLSAISTISLSLGVKPLSGCVGPKISRHHKIQKITTHDYYTLPFICCLPNFGGPILML